LHWLSQQHLILKRKNFQKGQGFGVIWGKNWGGGGEEKKNLKTCFHELLRRGWAKERRGRRISVGPQKRENRGYYPISSPKLNRGRKRGTEAKRKRPISRSLEERLGIRGCGTKRTVAACPGLDLTGKSGKKKKGNEAHP